MLIAACHYLMCTGPLGMVPPLDRQRRNSETRCTPATEMRSGRLRLPARRDGAARRRGVLRHADRAGGPQRCPRRPYHRAVDAGPAAVPAVLSRLQALLSAWRRLGRGAPGSPPAFAGAILTSSATGAQIYQWYFRKLKSLGWYFVTDNGCSSIQLNCPQFGHTGHGTREVFFLGVDSPQELPTVIGRMPPHACTVYEVSYEIFPSGGVRVPRPGLSFSGGRKCWWTGTQWRKRADMYP